MESKHYKGAIEKNLQGINRNSLTFLGDDIYLTLTFVISTPNTIFNEETINNI